MVACHLFKLSQSSPHEQTDGGIRLKADKTNFPILHGMSLYKLILHPNGLREPHWHANADELGYCLNGTALVSLYQTGDKKATFLVQKGDVFLIPSGTLHHVENIGDSSVEFILNFSHESPEDFNLSTSLNAFSNAVLGNTWGVHSDVLKSLKRQSRSSFATLRKGPLKISEEIKYATPYRYNLAKATPLLINEGGSVRVARHNIWPILENQAVYSLELTGQGMREPHWHPETAELGYVEKGRGRMTILEPSGSTDTYIMEEGDIYFIPKAYPHHIENLQKEPLLLQIFFDQAMPRDIGFTASILSYSDEVLASVTHTDRHMFEQLQKNYADLFIVNRINPLD